MIREEERRKQVNGQLEIKGWRRGGRKETKEWDQKRRREDRR